MCIKILHEAITFPKLSLSSTQHTMQKAWKLPTGQWWVDLRGLYCTWRYFDCVTNSQSHRLQRSYEVTQYLWSYFSLKLGVSAVWTMLSYTWCNSWGCPLQDQELESMILVPFHLRIFSKCELNFKTKIECFAPTVGLKVWKCNERVL